MLSPESAKLKKEKAEVDGVSELPLQTSALGFSPDQVESICEALMEGGNVDLLGRFLSTIPPSADLLRGNETLLKAQALVSFHREEFKELYAILESRDFHPSNHRFLQDLYLRARYKEAERSRGRSLGALDKCRLRKKYPLPNTIWDGEKSRNAQKECYTSDRYSTWGRDPEPGRVEPARERLTTIRLAVLPNGQDSVFLPRVGSLIKKIVVPLSMPESTFIEKIRAEFPSLRGDFCLCRVNRLRKIQQLELTSVCPAAIKACPLLRRSAVYIRPMENREEVENVHQVGGGNGMEWESQDMEEQKRLRVFRRDEEHGSTGPVRRRMTAIRLAALPNSRDTLLFPRAGLSIKKIVVPLSMPESAFIEKIRAEFPSLRGDFQLCRVNRQREIRQLQLSPVCPSAIKACPLLRRSAVYIRPMGSGEEGVGNVNVVGDGVGKEWEKHSGLEEPNVLEEEEEDEEEERNELKEEDMITDQADDKAVERVSVGLLECRVLPGQQNEEHRHSPVLDREMERRRRQFLERELRRIEAINTRKKMMNSIPEPDNGVTVQFKYPDGSLRRRRFLPSQPFQHIVAFAGSEEMASEIFTLQKAMSCTSLQSTQRGSLADNGITAPCTLYILWMLGDALEDIKSNSFAAHEQTQAAPPTTVPTFSPAPPPPVTVPTFSPAPLLPVTVPTFSPAPLLPVTVPTISPAPPPPVTVPTFSPAPPPPVTVPTFSPAPPPLVTVPSISPAPLLPVTVPTISPAPPPPVTVPSFSPPLLPPVTVPTISPAPPPPVTVPSFSPPLLPPVSVPTLSPDPSPPVTVTTFSPPPPPPIIVPSFSCPPPLPVTVPTLSPAPPPTPSPSNISSTPSSPDLQNAEEPFVIASALKTLKSRVHPLAPSANQINVLRNEEFDCALRAFRRPAFDPESKLDIVFIDEDGLGDGAADGGGPTREFCRLLMGQIQEHQIFEGPQEARTLVLDSVALHNNMYRIVGQMLAVCLIQGGVSPNFFSRRLFSQAFGLPSVPATTEEVVDRGLKAKLEKISSAETLDDARQAVNEAADELDPMGALWHLQSLEQRKELIEAAVQFYCERRIQAALQQLKEGLSTLGVLEEVTSHPQAFEKIFLQDTTSLKASDIVGLFQARSRSLPGSNRRRLEARAIAFWKDWLLEVEGLRRIPAMGFVTQPELAFLHPEDGLARFPKANTCSLVLHLPVGQSYTEFKNNMELGIGSGECRVLQ
ncbi:uncharacterized protein LOC125711944 isoform X3 [Brienomyrus brachyistius]|uniref:uncharacterized protein LOC125711944 isoform X3 n=1 Tax=Brienomyrus brachyistius TaxID=42636 RepID=UPI0020B450BD|nr:uncharacterized protein LOC125711944 isoform X3 [Brienomyrus brachyistius]